MFCVVYPGVLYTGRCRSNEHLRLPPPALKASARCVVFQLLFCIESTALFFKGIEIGFKLTQTTPHLRPYNEAYKIGEQLKHHGGTEQVIYIERGGGGGVKVHL